MTRVDSRGVLERAEDVVLTADFERTHEPVERCECGASLLTWADDSDARVCAGCGETPSYMLHPARSSAFAGDWERGVAPGSSAALRSARKGGDAPDVVGASRLRRVALLSAVWAQRLAPVIFRGSR